MSIYRIPGKSPEIEYKPSESQPYIPKLIKGWKDFQNTQVYTNVWKSSLSKNKMGFYLQKYEDDVILEKSGKFSAKNEELLYLRSNILMYLCKYKEKIPTNLMEFFIKKEWENILNLISELSLYENKFDIQKIKCKLAKYFYILVYKSIEYEFQTTSFLYGYCAIYIPLIKDHSLLEYI